MVLDEPSDDDTHATVDGMSFVMSPTDARLLPPGTQLRLDYYEDVWNTGYYISAGSRSSCEL